MWTRKWERKKNKFFLQSFLTFFRISASSRIFLSRVWSDFQKCPKDSIFFSLWVVLNPFSCFWFEAIFFSRTGKTKTLATRVRPTAWWKWRSPSVYMLNTPTTGAGDKSPTSWFLSSRQQPQPHQCRPSRASATYIRSPQIKNTELIIGKAYKNRPFLPLFDVSGWRKNMWSEFYGFDAWWHSSINKTLKHSILLRTNKKLGSI